MRALAGILLLGLLTLGCQLPQRGAGQLLAADDPRPAGLLARLDAEAAKRQALRGSLRMQLAGTDINTSLSQRVAAERPGRLRVEVLALFSQVAAVLATDGTRFDFLDMRSGEVQSGFVRDDLLWQTARIDLRPDEAVDLLLGVVPVFPQPLVVEAREFEGGAIEVVIRDGASEARQRISFDTTGQLERAEEENADGELRWRARFSDHRTVSGEALPHEIALRFPRVDASATLRFSSMQLAASLPPDLFVLQVPAGSAAQLD